MSIATTRANKERAERAKAKPYISNYASLDDWLKKVKAIPQWQEKCGSSMIEGWLVNARLIVVHVYGNQSGWDIYTSGGDSSIEATLKDVEQRVGLR